MHVRELTVEECWDALAKMTSGRLACALDDQPYVVPMYFVAEGDHVYSFSMPGQKIQWMRANPRVCLEADVVGGASEWTSLVAVGRYAELRDVPELQVERDHALELLQGRAMWWEPGVVAAGGGTPSATLPIFYRIDVTHLSGHRAAT